MQSDDNLSLDHLHPNQPTPTNSPTDPHPPPSWELTEAQKPLLLPPLDPYDNEIVMPLAEFAAHPIAAELIHDGQALQVGCVSGWLAGALRSSCSWCAVRGVQLHAPKNSSQNLTADVSLVRSLG
jgi:hypothetical protein